MDLATFTRLVKDMRTKQKAYFRDRLNLNASKEAERRVDAAIQNMENAEQPSIFLSREERIADSLMTNGLGEVADRLVLVDAKGKELGGLCRCAIVDRIRSEP